MQYTHTQNYDTLTPINILMMGKNEFFFQKFRNNLIV